MLLNLFLHNVWLAIGLWVALYLMDYIFTLKAARMYQEGAKKHFTFPAGIELNPYFEKDIANLRRFSFRFFLMLFFIGGLLLIAYSIIELPEVFAFLWGMLVWMQLANHFRHVHNLMAFHYARTSTGVSGQLRYEHWLSLRLSALDMFCFTVFFLIVFLFWGSFFVLGGALGCLSIALRHLIDSKKSRSSAPTSSEGESTSEF